MAKRIEIINAAVEYWFNLISMQIEKFKHDNQIDVMPRFVQRKYNFEVKLDDFKELLTEYLYEEFPKTARSPMIQLTCIGAPSGALRAIMQKSDLDPHLLSGKIIEMEINHKYAKVWDRKLNNEIDLAQKNLNNKQGFSN